MTHHSPIRAALPATVEPESAALAAALDLPNPSAHWTPDKRAAFLRELAATHSVSAAARSVGMSRQSAYRLRTRLRGQPFDVAWRAAFRRKVDALAEALIDRALHGVEVPHFHKGELIHTSRRFDERAAVALLAMRGSFNAEVPCWQADQLGIRTDNFEALVGEVERGGEEWELRRQKRRGR
jgi:hypothetical protein